MTDSRRILIVEDDALIGMLLTDMFEALDLPKPAQAASLREATAFIERETFAGALIDVNLAGEKGWPVAEMMANRGIPFAFTTGGGSEVPDAFKHVPIIMKPFRLNDIEAAIQNFKN